ncbi:hypothetical protein D7S40_04155 [Staphylococcus aureus]|uniref:Nitrogen regulation protein NIFR3 n=1 Tax=Staphylococcus aureus TaxID=1280 RepID=A0A641AB12_STAAU|nr:hypothetical protein D7S40_04155 [Staphylococcus aureus]
MMIESGTSQCPRLYNVILAGPQHREIGTPISTGNGSWGWGPNTENFVKKFYRQCELGINEFNFVKISFLSHSLCMSLIMYSYF